MDETKPLRGGIRGYMLEELTHARSEIKRLTRNLVEARARAGREEGEPDAPTPTPLNLPDISERLTEEEIVRLAETVVRPRLEAHPHPAAEAALAAILRDIKGTGENYAQLVRELSKVSSQRDELQADLARVVIERDRLRDRDRDHASVLDFVRAEDLHQLAKGRGAAYDDARTHDDWMRCLEKIIRKRGGDPETGARFVFWVKIARLAIAAIESAARRRI